MDNSIEKANTTIIPIFNLEIPTQLHDVDTNILDPRNTYSEQVEWNTKATDLATKFIQNFEQYTDNEQGKQLIKAGPQL